MNPDAPTPDTPTSALRSDAAVTPLGEVYAAALTELALQHQKLDAVARQADGLRELIGQNPDFRRLIANPILDRGQRTGMLQRLFEGRLDDLLYRFLQTVNRKDRLAALPSILAAFDQQVAEHRNQLTVRAHVARPLDDATAGRVADGLGAALGKTVTLQQTLDPSLIGGLRLRIGDQLLDASVASQLERYKRQLIAAGRERARRQAAEAGAEGLRD
jgi:F-type H+-transporting ATPase subunit delta